MSDKLIIGKTKKGTYYAQPLTWAGQWDKDGILVYGNTLFEVDTEEEVKAFVKGFEVGRNWK